MTGDSSYTFSYSTESYAHPITEEPTGETVPISIFSQASAMQALARYLVDRRDLGFTEAARLLGRSPKSLWASYHQAAPLQAVDDASLQVPLSIFPGQAPLEALVTWLRGKGLRNVDVARLLNRSPKTIHTVARRAGVGR